jgi:light-regulated signal transduction histidine kinase (bacteriophytochrome)
VDVQIDLRSGALARSGASADLAACERESIRGPGSIQPHGVLLVLRQPELEISHASANAAALLGARRPVVGSSLGAVIGEEPGRRLRAALRQMRMERQPRAIGMVKVAGERGSLFRALAHWVDAGIVLELECVPHGASEGFVDLSPAVRGFIGRLETVGDTTGLTALAAREVRALTGFDRVLIYRFDVAWDGHVVAEDRDADVASYLDLPFPEGELPQPAPGLDRGSRIRLVADTASAPVPIEPAADPAGGAPLDLSCATLRSVPPVQLEHLRGVGIAASMSISVLVDGRPWGLIACHHRRPRLVPFEVRSACELLAQVFALQIAAREHVAEYERRVELRAIQTRLLACMAEEPTFIEGLTNHPAELLAFAAADGAAVVLEDDVTLLGRTPGEPIVRALVEWLIAHGREDVFSSDDLAAVWPRAADAHGDAGGVLAIAISKLHRSYVIWFRSEIARPARRIGSPGSGTEARLGRCVPWRPAELEMAGELRNAIVGIVLRKAEELAQLSADLARTNSELEAFSYSVSHDLRAPFRHIVGFSELLRDRLGPDADPEARRYIATIIESAQFAGTLVDNLLSFSRIGRSELHLVPVSMSGLVDEVRRDLADETAGRDIEWRIGPLPDVVADPLLLRLALRNLLSNAVKYTRDRSPATIAMTAETAAAETVFAVRDNGAGFDMRYVDKLFGVFQRLHRIEDFEGTGIGLANVRRIVARHGGRTWAEGEPGVGATFYFTLPRTATSETERP